jgi:ionotropic glutamate receptor
LALDISEAIIYLTQSGELQLLEQQMLSFPKCSTPQSDTAGIQNIGPEPFLVLFIVSGGASTVALLFACLRLLRRRWSEMNLIQSMLMGRGLWLWLAAFFFQSKQNNELEL